MATKLFCDLCGKEIKKEEAGALYSISRTTYETGTTKRYRNIDAHDKCFEALLDEITKSKGAEIQEHKWLIVEDHALGEDGNRGKERMIRQERFDTEEEAKIFLGGLRTSGWINRFVARDDEGYKPFKVGDDY